MGGNISIKPESPEFLKQDSSYRLEAGGVRADAFYDGDAVPLTFKKDLEKALEYVEEHVRKGLVMTIAYDHAHEDYIVLIDAEEKNAVDEIERKQELNA